MASSTNVRQTTGKNGLEMFILEHSSGATAEVYSLGATVTSIKTAAGQELLFLSENAVFDGKSPIRGGIPVIWPKFGPGWNGASNPSDLPSHGFARRSKWSLVVTDGSVGFELTQDGITAEHAKAWPHKFTLRYEVTLTEDGFGTSLTATNTGEAAFEFQALLHTYYAIEAVGGVSVEGLAGTKYIDKLQGPNQLVQGESPITIAQETDAIYIDASKALSIKGLKGPQTSGTLTLSSTAGKHDCVVWNPWVAKAAKMGDFGDEEYHTMICVEPGNVAGPSSLAAGAKYTLAQSFAL